jgi:hypothetical protein
MRRYDLLYVIPAILALFCISVYLIGLYPSPARPGIEYVIPAVGFSLTADYGYFPLRWHDSQRSKTLTVGSMVAIHLANHTSLNVAKIHGSPGYTSFMRQEQTLSPDTPLCSVLGTCARKPDAGAARDMIEALKSSAEAYFGTTFCFVSIAVPDASKGNYQKEILEAAVRASGLRQSMSTQSAARIAIYANQPEDLDDIPDEQIALAIHYTRSSITLDLFCDDGGILDLLRHDYSFDSGAEGSGPADWDMVRSALGRISQPPFRNCPSWNPTGQKKINYLVLYGESVKNGEFLRAIAGALGEDLVAEARWWEPEWGVALKLAEYSYRGQNDIDFRGEPAFGCRWRSGLYYKHSGDL